MSENENSINDSFVAETLELPQGFCAIFAEYFAEISAKSRRIRKQAGARNYASKLAATMQQAR